MYTHTLTHSLTHTRARTHTHTHTHMRARAHVLSSNPFYVGADHGTLSLLTLLTTANTTTTSSIDDGKQTRANNHILLLGAYRDNEVCARAPAYVYIRVYVMYLCPIIGQQ